jgi:hypothetical protein
MRQRSSIPGSNLATMRWRHSLAAFFFGVLASCTWVCIGAVAAVASVEVPLIIEQIFGDLAPTSDADVNGDGEITAADIVAQELSVSMGPTPTVSPTPTTEVLFDGTIAQLSPHDIGDTFVYRVTGPATGQTASQTITVTLSGASGNVLFEIRRTDNKHETDSYTDTGTQLLFKRNDDLIQQVYTTCTPPIVRLQLPLLRGQMFPSTSTCVTRAIAADLFLGSVQDTETYTGTDLIDTMTVMAGTFSNVIRLAHSMTAGNENETDDIYIAPGVGIIRSVNRFSGQTQTLELTSAKIGGRTIP